MTATLGARMRAEARSAVAAWSSLDSRTVRIYPIPGGGAEFSIAGVDRTFASVFDAEREVRALGLTPHVERFGATPLVLAEAPAP